MTTPPEIPTELGDSFAPGACWRLLATARIGRLAVLVRHEPLVFPVSHVVDDDTIVFRIHASDMLAGMTAHPRVAFEVDEIDTATGEGWSVLAKGDAQITYEPPAESDGTTRRYSTRLVHIRPTEVTGRRVVIPIMAAAEAGSA